MKINKNKIKYLAIPIPLVVLWLSFFIGHLAEFGQQWWAVPYIFTCLASIIGSVVFTITVVDRHYYDE